MFSTAEDDEPVVDPRSESAAPLPAPDSLEDEPKGDTVEQSSSVLVKSNSEEKTDDEGDISNKTSVESLKETNENNNNDNTNFGQRRGWCLSHRSQVKSQVTAFCETVSIF